MPQETLTFVYDGWLLVQELSDQAPEAVAETPGRNFEFFWGIDGRNSTHGLGGVGNLVSQIDYGSGLPNSADYSYDANGNVTQVVGAFGLQGILHREYDPCGRIVDEESSGSPIICRFRFSTKYTDQETSLVYYGFRYYLPGISRWLNRDPIGEQGGLNIFGFIKNNPILDTDILGLEIASPMSAKPPANALQLGVTAILLMIEYFHQPDMPPASANDNATFVQEVSPATEDLLLRWKHIGWWRWNSKEEAACDRAFESILNKLYLVRERLKKMYDVVESMDEQATTFGSWGGSETVTLDKAALLNDLIKVNNVWENIIERIEANDCVIPIYQGSAPGRPNAYVNGNPMDNFAEFFGGSPKPNRIILDRDDFFDSTPSQQAATIVNELAHIYGGALQEELTHFEISSLVESIFTSEDFLLNMLKSYSVTVPEGETITLNGVEILVHANSTAFHPTLGLGYINDEGAYQAGCASPQFSDHALRCDLCS